MAEWTNDELQQALVELSRRASVDPEFRALAVKDAAAAIAKINSKPLPADFVPQFHDNSGKIIHIPLPDPIAGIEELSEAELAAAAGGDDELQSIDIQGDAGTGKAAGHVGWSR